MFAIGLVPYRRDLDALAGGHDDGLQLGCGLTGKTVAHT